MNKEKNDTIPKENQLTLFRSENGSVEFEVSMDFEKDTVWLSENQMVMLFDKSRRTIGEHIANIYSEGELDEISTWRNFRQVQIEGGRQIERTIKFYNLDLIISVGYRVKSKQGIEFRKWATSKLKDYLIQGYSINTKRLEENNSRIESLQQQVLGLQNKLINTENQLTDGFYSIIKGHAFSDGKKRIGSFIFVWFLEQNNFHLYENGQRKITQNTL